MSAECRYLLPVRFSIAVLAMSNAPRLILMGAMLFAAPGVILGGQLGPLPGRRLPAHIWRGYVTVLMVLGGSLLVRLSTQMVFKR
jgi:hypothetical protein